MRGDAVNHTPYYRDTDGDTALLCIHGILGTPRHFDFLLPAVPVHWTIHNILLPGHGGSMSDFARSTMEQWKRQVQQELENLMQRCSKIYILAHSMGCLFAVSAALQYTCVRGLFLLAPPMVAHIAPVMVRNGLRVAFDRIPQRDATAVATRRACSIATTARLWEYLRWLPNYRALPTTGRCSGRCGRFVPKCSGSLYRFGRIFPTGMNWYPPVPPGMCLLHSLGGRRISPAPVTSIMRRATNYDYNRIFSNFVPMPDNSSDCFV